MVLRAPLRSDAGALAAPSGRTELLLCGHLLHGADPLVLGPGRASVLAVEARACTPAGVVSEIPRGAEGVQSTWRRAVGP